MQARLDATGATLEVGVLQLLKGEALRALGEAQRLSAHSDPQHAEHAALDDRRGASVLRFRGFKRLLLHRCWVRRQAPRLVSHCCCCCPPALAALPRLLAA